MEAEEKARGPAPGAATAAGGRGRSRLPPLCRDLSMNNLTELRPGPFRQLRFLEEL